MEVMTNNNDELEKKVAEWFGEPVLAVADWIDHYAEQWAREAVVEELEWLSSPPMEGALPELYLFLKKRIKELKAK
jgi:hypothetical protein